MIKITAGGLTASPRPYRAALPVVCFGAALLAACNDNQTDGVVRPANQLPVAVLRLTPGADGLTVSVTDQTAAGKGLHDPDGRIVKAVVDFGDGQRHVLTAVPVSPLNVTHRYLREGIYRVTLTVWDNDGAHTTVRKSLSLKAGRVDNVATGLLNDTGIGFCTDDTNRLFPSCESPALGLWAELDQDALTGRDALAFRGELVKQGAGNAGFDYTKIGAGGQRLPAGAETWHCVVDNHTGLMWEIKTDDGGLRDWRHRYTWHNPDNALNGGGAGYTDPHELQAGTPAGAACGGTLAACNTRDLAAAVNAAGLCGYNDWRVPDQEQLLSLPDYGRSDPAIDAAYFPNTAFSCESPACGGYWSSSTVAGLRDAAWYVSFRHGADQGESKGLALPVRLVRFRQ
jgi:hypothetical protein